MGISSLGAGAGVLTQDLLDQLKDADQAQYINPLDARVRTENAKKAAFDIINAYMDNVASSLGTLTQYGVFESRTTSVGNKSVVDVTAADSSDIQDFSIEVVTLATKEIVQSGALAFGSKTDTVASGTGKLELTVGAQKYTIGYDGSTTLEGLKDLINKTAGDSVSATVVQIGNNDFRLFLNANESGVGQDISITDVVGAGEALNTALTTGMSNVQDAVNANFKYNGQTVIRTSNVVSDLLSGVTITLKEAGTTSVSVKQNRDNIAAKIENFMSKYNAALVQLNTDTKSSENIAERGIFSGESTIKNMKADLKNMLSRVGEGMGELLDYGIKIEDDGRLTLDSAALNKKLDENPANVQAFLAGGAFTKSDGTTVELTGVFGEMEEDVSKYTKYDAVLDVYKNSIASRLESLNEQREKALERLTSKYEVMAKQFAAYDLVISKLNSTSAMFTNMVNAESRKE